ncbi:MAG: metallophosphoesterase [Gemmatimonadetes bacterium]|nr:metallophosphoesterase [Gemmatimonadota bacterium]
MSIALLSTLLAGCATDAAYGVLETPPPSISSVEARLYLIGDAGLDSPGRTAVLAHARADLAAHAAEHPEVPALMVFLGDNIYDVGARVDFRAQDLAILAAQVRAVAAAPAVRGIFLPGNHDWGKGAPDPEGRTAIQVQQRWIREIEGAGNVGFLPNDECPGPARVTVSDDVHVLFIDTEWLLRQPGGCGGAELFYSRLTDELRRLRGDRVVLVAHHPLVTGGPHGGNVSLFENVPIIYYLAIKSGLSVQDLASGQYAAMIRRIRQAIQESGTRPLAMATGHDHSLQVIRLFASDLPVYQLVSGSASKSSRVANLDGTRYATSRHGYMRVDFTPGQARLVTFAWVSEAAGGPAELRPVFTCLLSEGVAETCAEALMENDR